MNDKELEEWINKHPLLANCVVPVAIVGVAMLTMFTLMQIIDYVI